MGYVGYKKKMLFLHAVLHALLLFRRLVWLPIIVLSHFDE
jgi:hypothetical protein